MQEELRRTENLTILEASVEDLIISGDQVKGVTLGIAVI